MQLEKLRQRFETCLPLEELLKEVIFFKKRKEKLVEKQILFYSTSIHL